MNNIHPKEYLTNISCSYNDEDRKCNIFEPVPSLSLYSTNPATRKRYTEKERNQKKEALNNRCKIENKKTQLCCDPNDSKLNVIVPQLSDEWKGQFNLIKKDAEGNYYKCDSNNMGPDCKSPSGYEYCKLSSPSLRVDDNNKIHNILPDCISEKCSEDNIKEIYEDKTMSDFNKIRDFEIIHALQKDNVNHLQNLLKDNKRIQKPMKSGYLGNTILHNAIVYESKDILNELFKIKLPLDTKNKDGNTALHLAGLKGDANTIHKLLQMGANLTLKNVLGDTPLHSTVRSANKDSVALLLEQNASVFEINRLGETPLHVAFISPDKNLEIIKLLIKYGSDLFAKNNNDYTPLKTLEFQNNSKENAIIRTFVINKIISLYGSNYINIIKQNPEFANFQFVTKSGKPIDMSNMKNLSSLEINIPDSSLPDYLIYDVDKKSMKYKNLMEDETLNKKRKKEDSQNKSKTNNNTKIETFDVMNSLASDYPPVNNLMEQFESKKDHVKKVRMILILIIIALLMSFYVIKTF